MAGFERITDGVTRGDAVTVIVDGEPVATFDGESVATALLASDRVAFRRTPKRDTPRGAFCAMGVCFDCLVTIDGLHGVRACTVAVREGMRIDTRPDVAAPRALRAATTAIGSGRRGDDRSDDGSDGAGARGSL